MTQCEKSSLFRINKPMSKQEGVNETFQRIIVESRKKFEADISFAFETIGDKYQANRHSITEGSLNRGTVSDTGIPAFLNKPSQFGGKNRIDTFRSDNSFGTFGSDPSQSSLMKSQIHKQNNRISPNYLRRSEQESVAESSDRSSF